MRDKEIGMNDQELKVRTYTKADLINELSSFDDDTPVFFSYTYGDYWKTDVAESIETVEEANIEWSDYHRMYKVNADEEPSKTHKVIVLKGY